MPMGFDKAPASSSLMRVLTVINATQGKSNMQSALCAEHDTLSVPMAQHPLTATPPAKPKPVNPDSSQIPV